MHEAIVTAISAVTDCADVTDTQLAAITSLATQNKGITSLQSGDFSGLTGMTNLLLNHNRLVTLPENIFAGLDSLTQLHLQVNQIAMLPENIFDGLGTLTDLDLSFNQLVTLPENIFAELNMLIKLSLIDNPFDTLPVGIFDGLPTDRVISRNSGELAQLPPDITISVPVLIATVGTLIEPITITSMGSAATSYRIAPNLNTNTGLDFNTMTGIITGTPSTASGATDYTITATNASGSADVMVTITVYQPISGADTSISGMGDVAGVMVETTGSSNTFTAYLIEPFLDNAVVANGISHAAVIASAAGDGFSLLPDGVVDISLPDAANACPVAAPCTVTLPYMNADLMTLGVEPSELRILHYTGGSAGVWEALPMPELNTTTQTVTASTSSFSPFVLGVMDVSNVGLTAIESLNEAIAPRLVQSMLAASASAIDSRIDASFSGAGQLQVAQVASYQLDGQTRLSSLKSTLMQKLPVYASSIKNNTIDLKQMLGNSSFVLPLNVDGGDGSGAADTNLTIWGRGDYTNLSGKNWKGNVVSAQLGADTRVRDDLLVGGLLSSSKGDVDYTASGSEDTEYKHSITSIHPYIAWSSNDINLWASAGYGQGKLEIEDTADKNNSDTQLLSLSGGAKGQVAEGINLKSDLNLMQLRIDESANKNIAAQKITSQRLRLLLEIERERQLETGVLKPTLEIGARYDGGDGDTGTGAVLNGSLNYTNAITGWTVGGKIHTLIGRKDDKEWGISGVVSKHVAVNGRGVSFNLTPSYGQNQDNGGGSAEQAWQQPAEVRNSGNKHNNMRINTRLGYGFAPSGNGLLTPYSEATFGESERYLLGINWQRHSRFGMNLSGEHDAGNTKNHVLGVNWTRPRYDMTLSAGRNEANNGTANHRILLESRIGL